MVSPSRDAMRYVIRPHDLALHLFEVELLGVEG